MIYTMENDLLKVSVTTWGAQVCSVVRKCDGVEHIWQADKEVWGYHGPILFPYTGHLKDEKMRCKGQIYEGRPHGIARTREHTFVRQSDHEIVLELTDSPETLALWPYRFRLESRFILEGDRLTHRLTVENRDEEKMPFGIGYHPAFALPFDAAHQSRTTSCASTGFRAPCVSKPCPGAMSPEKFILWQRTPTPSLWTRSSLPMTPTACSA